MSEKVTKEKLTVIDNRVMIHMILVTQQQALMRGLMVSEMIKLLKLLVSLTLRYGRPTDDESLDKYEDEQLKHIQPLPIIVGTKI